MSDLANTPVAALLELAASQLEVAAHSTNAQMETLASSIAALVLLGAELQAANGAGVAPDALAQKIVERAQTAVVAMQFHDQLVQRVAHVRDVLTALNEALQGMPAAEVEWARKIIAAFELPENAAKGAISLDGKMVELLHAEMARRTLAIAEAVAARA